ncbi:CaiB/BaiF CoA-transferase family protein [Ruegeria sp. Ofav3-42]|uniref:CaiB/BaiF CoA transferase family protein n=1 Tax=Ruegeria sp. Ofav3-42 TaxID=2917759 RepID=UPI001EF42E8E|nr:CoA transferase [Ruegeria sp. Ofav3-42]MCG7522565.1 CoA transferase [Ruegeria sp. Ofav3-42]
MTTPLSGIKVIDFTHVLAGPACAYFLGLLGATVIKVESIGRGDAMRHRGGTDANRAANAMSTAYLAQGSGKQSIELDLTTEGGREVMHALLADADVLVENHLPDTMRGFGLDEDCLRARHPHLIHCAMTGYGRGGELENAPAYDVNIQAACGIMTLTGTKDTGPLRTGAPIMDYGVALAAGFAISTALFQREKTGKGSFIDVSMLETGLTMMTSTIVDFLATGNVPQQRGNAANSRTPGAGSFACKEGTLALGANEEPQFHRLAESLGKSKWLEDPRFQTRAGRKVNAKELEKELVEVLLTKTAQEWETLLLANKVPAARVRTLPECLNMHQVTARGYLQTTPDGTTVPTLPFRIGSACSHAPTCDAPGLGDDTQTVLTSAGFSESKIAKLRKNGAIP